MNFHLNLKKSISEMFPLGKGIFIKEPGANIRLGKSIFLNRRVLKHIIEERKADGYSQKEISLLFARIPRVLQKPEFTIINPNKRHSGSYISGRTFYFGDKNMLVVYINKEKEGEIINAFYRSKAKYNKIKAKSERR